MLPLSLLTAAQGHPMLVELKNGQTYNGHLVNCDNWMNIMLREVICTSPDGERFWRLPEVYLRGNLVKYLRVPDEIIDIVKEQQQLRRKEEGSQQRDGGYRRHDNQRGGRGGHRGGSGRGGYSGRGGRQQQQQQQRN